jgi:D-alanyl-lipoteichoic acid acyltransferase DltB (MBOAT superfamily)
MLLSGSHITAGPAGPQRTMATLRQLLLHLRGVTRIVLLIFTSLQLLYRANWVRPRIHSSKTAAYQRPCGQPGLPDSSVLHFLLENVWLALSALGIHFHRPHYDIILPPGISYFTFASLSYILDVYYERIQPTRSRRDYSLFISFFPKLLAGPIMRAGDFLSQVQQRVYANAAAIESGLFYFLLGAVKKLVISDQVAGPVNLIFSSPGQYDGLTLLLGAMGYAVQIYCDFSGYTDMAIGSALLLGFKLPENFQMPYSSVTITEFWRRWHITLSAWFRDYVFIPMEVARKNARSATLRTTISLMATMLLCGLCTVQVDLVIWGGIHGVALAVHRAWTLGTHYVN